MFSEGTTSVAITPDGTTALMGSETGLVILDLTQPLIVPTTLGGFSLIQWIAITPNGAQALVTDSGACAVAVLDLLSSPIAIETLVTVGTSPVNGIAINPAGTVALVANNDGSSPQISVLSVGPTVTYGYDVSFSALSVVLSDIAITPDGTKALVSCDSSNQVYVLDLTQSPISSWYTVSVGSNPQGIAITPDGTKAFVVNEGDNSLSVLDLTESPIYPEDSVPMPYAGQNIAITPDGKLAYVTCESALLISVFDLTKTPISPIDEIETDNATPLGIAITPDQSPIASFVVSTNNMTVSLDGSASSSPRGTITQYQWSFGDGTTVTTTGPTTTHTYASGGLYILSLTVVNSTGTSTAQTFTGKTMSNNGSVIAKSSKAYLFED